MSGVNWIHVDDQLRKKLFDTILGKGKTFSKVWLLQHIDFPSIYNECRLQIKQYYNGPCGAVASLQVVYHCSRPFCGPFHVDRRLAVSWIVDSIRSSTGAFIRVSRLSETLVFQAWLVKTLLFGDVGKIPRHLSEKQKLIELRKRGLIGALSTILFLVGSVVTSIRFATV